MIETSPNDSPRGERELIREILAALPSSPDLIIPPGDDCASVRIDPGQELILTSDPVILGTHFDSTATPKQIGHKAAGRVLSDLAAMGAEPGWILLNVTAPSDYPQEHLKEIIVAARDLASPFGAGIAGGDLARSDTLSVHAFACGTVPAGTAIRRDGAQPGDHIYVTGELGGSRSGKHLNFTPRVSEGVWLRQAKFASAMIDTSDGPATDLRHIIEASGTGARLICSEIPSAPCLADLDFDRKVTRALCDGEDFELLFTVPASLAAGLMAAWSGQFDTPLTCIGSVTKQVGQIIAVDQHGKESLFSEKGFDHFG